MKNFTSVFVSLCIVGQLISPAVVLAQTQDQQSLQQMASLISALQGVLNSLKAKVQALKGGGTVQTAQAQIADVTSGLIGHWKFDEGTGTTATDSSGNNNTGTLTNGPTWTTGKIGGAVSLDGSNDYVDAGSRVSLDNLPAITIAGWFKKTKDGRLSGLVRKGGDYQGSGGWSLIELDNDSAVDQGISFGIGYSGNELFCRSVNGIFTNGVWHHIAATWDGSMTATNCHIYLNGSEVSYGDQQNATGTRDDDAATNFIMGDDPSITLYNGLIDEVRAYNRALSASEVQTIYSNGNGSVPLSDTTAPTVSITAPTSGSTVSGSSVTVSANASDNVGVVGVQFKLDGSYLGAEDTTSPYSISWNSTTASNGLHTLSATARDAAGNTTISSGITVTVSNTAPPADTQVPSVPTGLSASVISSSQINLSWTASTDNVGVTGYRVERCQGFSCTNFTQIATPTVTSYSDTSLTANTTYRYQVRTADAAGNLSGYSSIVSGTTQATGSGTIVFQDFNQPIPINPGTSEPLWEEYNGSNTSNTCTRDTTDNTFGCVAGSTGGFQWHFFPYNGGYPFPQGYAQYWIQSGTWSPNVNRMTFQCKVSKNISRDPGGSVTWSMGTYSDYRTNPDISGQAVHFYHYLDNNWYANKWVYITLNRKPQHLRGEAGSQEYVEDPTYNGSYRLAVPTHYYDSLLRFYMEATDYPVFSGVGGTLKCDNFQFATVANEPDQQVASVTATYSGTAYEVTWSAPKNQAITFNVRYSPNSMKVNGFTSGTNGGTVSGLNSDYTSVIWTSLNMPESSTGMYVAIQPQGQTNFTEVNIPNSPGSTPPTTLLGDLNSDRAVNALDWSIMNGAWNTASQPSDINSDGIVNSIDFSLMNQNWGRTI